MTIPTLAQMLTPRGRCIFDPSGIERIAFDMLAMLFLLYDLCLTPVTIAWDFPMSGWLLPLVIIHRSSMHVLSAR